MDMRGIFWCDMYEEWLARIAGQTRETLMAMLTSSMDSVFYDDTPAYEHEECEVRIEGSSIFVSYEDDEHGTVLYSGTDHGSGHFVLECPPLAGKATLHKIPGSRVLEGYWTEEGARGFWRILLPASGA